MGVGSLGPEGSEATLLGYHSAGATRETEDCCLSVVASAADPGFAAASPAVESVNAVALTAAVL